MGEKYLKYIQGQKNGMEEWSVPLFSSLQPDQYQTISSDSLIDLWNSVGIQDSSLFFKKLQIQIDDGRVNVHDVRTIIDTTIRDHPMGNIILASYKTELLYLWERCHNTVQELDKTREQYSISEKRIESII